MKHRLFHSLVLSSAALLEGCATQGAAATASTTPPASETARAPAPPAPAPAPAATATPAATTDAQVDAMVADARACREVGWSTTKSASMRYSSVTRGARQYFCLNDAGIEHYGASPRCCLLETSP